MVPDRQLIMENMLMAEGFVEVCYVSNRQASDMHISAPNLASILRNSEVV
jgi:hypothetical protein